MWCISKCEQMALWHFSSTVISRRSLLTYLSNVSAPTLPGWAKHQLFFEHTLDVHRQKPRSSSLCSQKASFIVWFSTMAVENIALWDPTVGFKSRPCYLPAVWPCTSYLTSLCLNSLICKTEVIIGSLDSWTAWRRNETIHRMNLIESLACIWPLGKSIDITLPFTTACPSMLWTSQGQSIIP